MVYEVTASRRRPQRFEDLAGQEFVAATLKNAIQTKKIAHAYLFSGPRGCGKTSSARILAKALNCQTGPAATPCGTCSACVEITRGASLDVIEIDGASNTSVNDIRQIKDEVLFPPNSCRYKIYIIDEVHMLSTSAFNALLKTIEEPPPYVIFIFATTELHKVPATIKSRCQQFNFRLVSVEQIKNLLSQAAQETGLQAEDEALYWIAREATGSIRDAYTLFDQVAAFSDGHITYDKIRDTLGLVGIERLNEITELCIQGSTAPVFEKLDEILQGGVSIEQFIANYADFLRSLLLLQSGITKESLLGQSAERFSAAILASWDAIKLERAIALFLQLFRDIRYSLDPRLELELALSRLCWLSNYVSTSEVKAALETTRNLLTGSIRTEALGSPPPPAAKAVPAFKINHVEPDTPQQAPKPLVAEEKTVEPAANIESPQSTPDASQNEPNTSTLNLRKLQEDLVEEIAKEKTMLATSLAQTGLWSENKGVILATIPTAYLKNQLAEEAVYINTVLSKLAGRPLQFKAEMQTAQNSEQNKTTPQEVELLCRVFKGTELDNGGRK